MTSVVSGYVCEYTIRMNASEINIKISHAVYPYTFRWKYYDSDNIFVFVRLYIDCETLQFLLWIGVLFSIREHDTIIIRKKPDENHFNLFIWMSPKNDVNLCSEAFWNWWQLYYCAVQMLETFINWLLIYIVRLALHFLIFILKSTSLK